MAQSNYELYGVYDAVSVSTDSSEHSPCEPNGLRTLTLCDQPGTDDDPYGGHKQREMLHDVEVSEVPDGAQLAADETTSYGFQDERVYAVWVRKGDGEGGADLVTVAYHDLAEAGR